MPVAGADREVAVYLSKQALQRSNTFRDPGTEKSFQNLSGGRQAERKVAVSNQILFLSDV